MGPLEQAALNLALTYPSVIDDPRMLSAIQLLGEPVPGHITVKERRPVEYNGLAYPQKYAMTINTASRQYRAAKKNPEQLAALLIHESRHLGPDQSEATAYKAE